MFYRLLRPFLFSLSGDLAHDLGQLGMRQGFWPLASSFLSVNDERLEVETQGMRFRNPVGLAAGFDKDGELTRATMSMGFGFVTVGSVRPGPHPGNPRPWMFRRTDLESIISANGIPSKGADYVALRLPRIKRPTPLIISIAGETIQEFVDAHSRLEKYGDIIEVNISCPNTEKGRKAFFSDQDLFGELIKKISAVRSKPLFVKIPFYNEKSQDRLRDIIRMSLKYSVNGITASNTPPIKEDRTGIGTAGLAGRALYVDTVRIISTIYEEVGNKIPIFAAGGIFSGKDAFELISRGATCVEILTALIYQGPSIAKRINTELLQLLGRNNLSSLEELKGRDAKKGFQ